jgi:hypothetical protein
MEIK